MTMTCEHFWRTTELVGYGWISTCEKCGKRESAEHSTDCLDAAIYKDLPCICGAEEEFQKLEQNSGRRIVAVSRDFL